MRGLWAALIWALLLAGPAQGAPAPRAAEEGLWFLRGEVLGGANPAGLMASGGAFRRLPRGEAGVALGAGPAYGQASAQAEWAPWPVLKLAVSGDLYRFFGAHDALLSFPGADSAFGDRERDALSGREEAGYGRRLLVQPTVRGRLGSFILLNQTDWSRHRLSGRGPYFLELRYDTLIKSRDTVLANRSMILYVQRDAAQGHLFYGPYFEFLRAEGSRLERARLGGALDLVFGSRLWPRSRPRFYLLTGLNLKDRNRRHQLFFAAGLRVDVR